MRPNESGTTRVSMSRTIASLNDLRIFVTRSSADSITFDTIRKRSKPCFIPFFKMDVELFMRTYIAGLPRLAAVKQSLALVPRSRGSRSVPRYFRMKSRKTLTLGVNRELSEYRAQGTTGFGCHPGKMGASRLAIAGSRAI